MPRAYGRKIGIGRKLLRPSLGLIARLLDWCVEMDDGHDTPCWVWQGRTDDDGYPEVKYRGHKQKAHRLAYAAFNGGINAGLDVDHICRNRACLNPDHLQAVDPVQNRIVLKNQRAAAAEQDSCPI